MGNPTATLEKEFVSAMNGPVSELDEAEREQTGRSARIAAMKFTYPSGSRPLEGFTIKAAWAAVGLARSISPPATPVRKSHC
jgi:hypothetical protein